MSLFGPIDDTDYRIWQQRGFKTLTELMQLGVKKKLPPLDWSLSHNGAMVGTVSSLVREHHPRDVFEQWTTALDGHRRVEPRRSRISGQGPTRSEHTDGDGRSRLFAGFTVRLTDREHPSSDVTIIAEWWEDEVAERAVRYQRKQVSGA